MKVEFANRILVNGNEERMSDSNKPTRELYSTAVIAYAVVASRLNPKRSRCSNNGVRVAQLWMGRAANRACITTTHQVRRQAWNLSRFLVLIGGN